MINYAGLFLLCVLPHGITHTTVSTVAHLSRKYIGCFRDNETRAISSEIYHDEHMTVELCINRCFQQNSPIAGLQAGGQCFCGVNYAKYGSRNEIDCSSPCKGNPSQICGGIWANSVYSDVDECNSGTSPCNPTSENCVNNIGSYRCECKVGFVKQSAPCEDDDECKLNTSSCNPTSENCVNTIGSFRCECKAGFVNEYGQCEDNDECKSDTSSCNPTSENCVNTIGSFRCECKAGIINESGQCEAQNCSPVTGTILGSCLATSLLTNVLLVAYLMKSAKSRSTESGKGMCMAQYDLQQRCREVSEPLENNYDDTPELVDDDNVYENVIREKLK